MNFGNLPSQLSPLHFTIPAQPTVNGQYIAIQLYTLYFVFVILMTDCKLQLYI